MSDLVKLLAASVRIIDLEKRVRALESENALLRARLDVMSLRRLKDQQRALTDREHLPALLRPQA